jgi:hypothetical protein
MSNIQIPNLPAVAGLSGAELLEAVQAGSSVKISLNQIGALFQIGAPVSFPLQVAIGGTGTTTSTGTGSVVLSNSPTLVAPTLGTGSFGLGTVSAPSITFTGDLNTGIWSPGADTVAASTNGVERIRIDASGNVGIGTNNPTSLLNLYNATSSILNVSGDSTVSILASRASTDATAANLNFRKYRGTIASPSVVVADDVVGNSNYSAFDGSGLVNVAQLQVGVEAISVPNDVSGYFRFFTRPAGTLAVLTERMRITSTGNVGIGTSSPLERLHVNTASGAAGIRISVSDVSYGNLFSSASGTTLNNITAAPLMFGTTNIERMRIDSAGNVGIATATPITPLHVAGASITTGVVYKNQPAQTSIAVASTLTIAQLLTGIIQYTGALATLTLPTGTDIEGGLPATFPTNMSFDFSVINTGSGTATLGTAAGLTLTGSMAVTAAASGMFRVRKTAVNTYTIYRIC